MADTIAVNAADTAGVGRITRIIGAVVDVKFKKWRAEHLQRVDG